MLAGTVCCLGDCLGGDWAWPGYRVFLESLKYVTEDSHRPANASTMPDSFEDEKRPVIASFLPNHAL